MVKNTNIEYLQYNLHNKFDKNKFKTPLIILAGIAFKGNRLKAGPGQVNTKIYCNQQLGCIRFHCVAKETMDLWAFLWPIYSSYEI